MPLTTGKRPWRRFGIAALIGLTALAIASATQAATCNTSTSELVFGIYDTFSTLPTDSATDIAVQCDAEATYVVSLSAGFGSSGVRRMQGSTGGTLQYGLYTDPARLTAWGDGTEGTVTVNGTVGSAPAAVARHTVYGRTPARQNVRVGSYRDGVTITVSY